jgi:hypothetical protein
MMGKAEDLASGTFYLAIIQASQYITVFVFYIIVARVLSPGEVGSLSGYRRRIGAGADGAAPKSKLVPEGLNRGPRVYSGFAHGLQACETLGQR